MVYVLGGCLVLSGEKHCSTQVREKEQGLTHNEVQFSKNIFHDARQANS